MCNINDALLNSVDEGKYSCSIFLDLSKAFDSVQHDLLLYKPEKLILCNLEKRYFNRSVVE